MAAFLFLLLLALSLSAFSQKKSLPLILFVVCSLGILALFLHHASDPLSVSL